MRGLFFDKDFREFKDNREFKVGGQIGGQITSELRANSFINYL